MVTQKYRISSNNRVFGKNIILSLILSCCLSDETFLLEVLHITFVWLNGQTWTYMVLLSAENDWV